jgi:hypothetical protein
MFHARLNVTVTAHNPSGVRILLIPVYRSRIAVRIDQTLISC